jgi:phage-related protein
MKRIVRLTESDLSRIVRRVIRESEKNYLFEAYEPGTTFKAGAVTYTINNIGNMQCNFTINITGGGKTYDLNANSINSVQDATLKTTLQGIMKIKLREAGC